MKYLFISENMFLYELGKIDEHKIWQQQEREKITYWEASQIVFITYQCDDRYNQTKCMMGRWKMNTRVCVEKREERDNMTTNDIRKIFKWMLNKACMGELR
jgi:hypothetical protein